MFMRHLGGGIGHKGIENVVSIEEHERIITGTSGPVTHWHDKDNADESEHEDESQDESEAGSEGGDEADEAAAAALMVGTQDDEIGREFLNLDDYSDEEESERSAGESDEESDRSDESEEEWEEGDDSWDHEVDARETFTGSPV